MPQRVRYKIPLGEKLKSIPGFFGLRLENEPQCTVIRHEGNKEIRRYQELVVAQTSVHGNLNEASEAAFLRLNDYISGHNLGEQHLSMTAPVFLEHSAASWTLSFVLPSHFTLASAPRPKNRGIRLHGLPAQLIAAIRYTGRNDEETMNRQSTRLLAWLGTHGEFKPVGLARWAQYDGPFTLPFVRRNEAQVEVAALQ